MGKALPEPGLGVVELWEPITVLAPIEGATIDNDAADRSAMATNPFGGGVHDDVDPVFNGTTEVSRTAKRIVALGMVDGTPTPWC